ncbi:hypothetical protein HNQ56_000961 [Anaerotaenia torta]|uniref:hypothetical protein n=1 Tax=Anaerotaenia torta TaxID=433293 RepID=UPI003D1BAAF3
MKISYRLRRTTKQYIIVSLICIVMIGGAAVFTACVITQQIKEEYELLLKEANQDRSMNQREVYAAAANIAAGDVITPDKVVKRKEYSSQPQSGFITEKEMGSLALIDIPADTQLLYSMITDPAISSELREVEYQVININSNIDSNDTVDIRIFFQNGEDYVILPKKVLKGYTAESASCFLWLTEEEIIRVRNAVVDAYLYPGSCLYTAKYIEPNIQEASVVTYTPSVEAIELIRQNPNITDTAMNELSLMVRKALENRLTDASTRDSAARQWDIGDNYIYQQYEDSMCDVGEELQESQHGRDAGNTENTENTRNTGKLGNIGKTGDIAETRDTGETGDAGEIRDAEETGDDGKEGDTAENSKHPGEQESGGLLQNIAGETEDRLGTKEKEPKQKKQPVTSPELGKGNQNSEDETTIRDYFIAAEG